MSERKELWWKPTRYVELLEEDGDIVATVYLDEKNRIDDIELEDSDHPIGKALMAVWNGLDTLEDVKETVRNIAMMEDYIVVDS